MTDQAIDTSDRRGPPWRFIGWGFAALLLLAPMVAMRFTDEVAWSGFDFAIFGAMLVAAGVAVELAVRASRNHAWRAGVAVAVGAAFLLVWINGAVGIIGSENPANLMFGGVLAVGAIGAAFARFAPRGMAKAMIAAAIAQVAVASIAQLAALGNAWPITGLFVVFWLASAALFARAARQRRETGVW